MKTIEDAVNFLNECLQLDPVAMSKLAFSRVPCNLAIASHPTLVVQISIGVDPNKDDACNAEVGMLGVLNGIFGDDNRRITAIFDNNNNVIKFDIFECEVLNGLFEDYRHRFKS